MTDKTALAQNAEGLQQLQMTFNEYAGTALRSVALQVSPWGARNVYMEFVNDLRLILHHGNEMWRLEQHCICGGGARWAPAVSKEPPILSCGGCGLALAPPGLGILTIFDHALPASLQAELTMQFEDTFDVLSAVAEATLVIVFIEHLRHNARIFP